MWNRLVPNWLTLTSVYRSYVIKVMSTIALHPTLNISETESRKPLEIKALFQRTNSRKWPTGNQVVTWPMTHPERWAHLENSWRRYLATIANYYKSSPVKSSFPVYCEAVRSAILATALLLVFILITEYWLTRRFICSCFQLVCSAVLFTCNLLGFNFIVHFIYVYNINFR